MVRYSNRLKDNLDKLQQWLEEFSDIIPQSYEEYRNDNIIMAASERYAERIIEEMTTVANVVLKEQGVTDREKPFVTLADLGIISAEFAQKLENSKGMRNIMVHQYEDFDEGIFYEHLKELLHHGYKFLGKLNQE